MSQNYSNTASVASLSANATSGAVAINVQSYTGFPLAPYWAMIARGTAAAELVKVTNVAGTVLTVTRAQGGTSAAAHSTGDTFEHVIPAATAQLAEEHPEATVAHNTVSPIVGRDDAVTLTAKTYRGAHVYNFTDTNPAAVTTAYEANADNGSAKTGFAHRNTAGAADQRGFLLEQSGTPRFEVFNDGTVKITPNGAAVRPGLQLDDDLDVNGPADISGNLTVSGKATVARAAGNDAISSKVTADANDRWKVTSDGTMWFGSGAAVPDANLWRVAADTLKTDDNFTVGGTLTVGASNVTQVPNEQIFTAGGTWTKPTGARWVEVICVGGGGGAPGCPATAAGEGSSSGAGGGGVTARSLLDTSALAATVAVTVGAAGAAGTSTVAGGTGGTSSFGAHVSAPGGDGGNASTATAGATGVSGGAGGSGGTGQILIPGEAGGNGRVISGNPMFHGDGGHSAFGPGGRQTFGSQDATSPSGGYGGGAGAAANGTAQASKAGAAGAPGVVIVRTYFAG